MKKHLLYLLVICMFFISSCMKTNFDDNRDQQVKDNVEQVFGMIFDKNHDWCTTACNTITVIPNSQDVISKVQVLATDAQDSTYAVRLLNEAQVTNNSDVEITIDVPINHTNLLVAFISDKGSYFYKKFNLGDTKVYFNDPVKSRTRGLSENYTIPTTAPIISGTVETFASQRNWLPGEVFYKFDYQTLTGNDYTDNFKTVFRTIIFNYFPNGRAYDNLPQIKKSGYYNETSYPITTGTEPIILSPVYKNDGGYHEVSEAEIYYYYFKGDLDAAAIEALPKYRAIDLSEVYTNNDNDNVKKQKSYLLAYFGNGIPTIGTTGSYTFPEGYKIGFCYKSNTTTDNKKKQGEIYSDGRLNYNINNWGNFKTSKLGSTDPRMAWMPINDKLFLCVESGTDKDFNDLIIDVEGGIKPIIIVPDEPEYNFYTFLFEDRLLGDYDMNDVVLKGRRINETTVEYTLMACGAQDELYINNIEGSKINKNTEVHELFGKQKGSFINTIKGDNTEYVIDRITVNKNFSFLDVTTQPYIFDKTVNHNVKIATVGQDPHAIMIPYDFKWPLERICIKDAYVLFNTWGANKVSSTDWYLFPVEDKIF